MGVRSLYTGSHVRKAQQLRVDCATLSTIVDMARRAPCCYDENNRPIAAVRLAGRVFIVTMFHGGLGWVDIEESE